MKKAELRKAYLEKRRGMDPKEVELCSLAIADGVFAEFDFNSLSVVHCFISIAKFNEVNTGIIFDRIWQHYPNVRTVVPRVNYETGKLEHFHYERDTSMLQSAWGIHEPEYSEMVDTKEIDLVIVPLLCFDGRGYRVGYGKGYYDRFLSECRPDCSKIGLSFFPPTDRIDDVHEGDVRLDLVVTPEGLHSPRV